jgi:hypothetical protein
MTTFSNEYITWVELVCIVPGQPFDADLAFYLITGEI